MTVVCVLADPPRPGLVFPDLVETAPLSADEAADLYAAGLRDICAAVEGSGGDLLVNYRPDDAIPDEHVPADADAEAEVRDALESALDAPADARFEVQVGETFAGRAGNTVTHLLEQEEVASVAVTEPAAAFCSRQEIDEAAMKLRRAPVVLGPSTGGRVYFAGFTEPIDFDGAYTPPALRTLTDRAGDAGHEVDFLKSLPMLETGADLAEALLQVETRRTAGRPVPSHVAEWLDDSGLTVVTDEDGGLELAGE
ncbi:hypothetical protein [Haloglomus litoreum]|uniref:hypothetical protein n=1 Tax=Haloglomus litoreum TaxID=3034026 RepID=UPI0023E8B89A|nr:hypothetical protein [Haloglomus sp. DT116]